MLTLHFCRDSCNIVGPLGLKTFANEIPLPFCWNVVQQLYGLTLEFNICKLVVVGRTMA